MKTLFTLVVMEGGKLNERTLGTYTTKAGLMRAYRREVPKHKAWHVFFYRDVEC
jgi:hypothetical protein